MFNNVLYQNITTDLSNDLLQDKLPQSLLFSGSSGSGKLTCALELARVLSCTGNQDGVKGEWSCACSSCLRHKALVNNNVLLIGPRECTLEIEAAKKTFLDAAETKPSYLLAARYLFVRSVRKLLNRFNPIVWEGDDKAGKIAPIVSDINDLLEELEPLKEILPLEELVKKTDTIVQNCKKLETSYLPDSIPIAHIRNASSWCHLTSSDAGKKILIFENADKMQENARNALLKILEEPPSGVVFILTTNRRGAIMPTILSRVRTYSFSERSQEQQTEVIKRVFHEETDCSAINEYLENFLPVKKEKLAELACSYLLTVQNIPPHVRRIIMQRFNPKGAVPVDVIINEACNFEPKILFDLFLKEIVDILRFSLREKGIKAQDQNAVFAWLKVIRSVSDNVAIFNQSASAALEYLSGELSQKALNS